MAYQNCATSTVVNKCVSERIRLLCSVPQGCPLSPLLFRFFFLEPFCQTNIQSSFIRVFKLVATKVHILTYADDVTRFA